MSEVETWANFRHNSLYNRNLPAASLLPRRSAAATPSGPPGKGSTPVVKTASSERSASPKLAARNGAAAPPRIGRLDGTGPMWQQIRRVLAQPILRGDWPPGTRMPAEHELTER